MELVSREDIPPPEGTPYISELIGDTEHYWLEPHYDGKGLGVIGVFEPLTVTGHSLGRQHLASIAVALFPENFDHAYTFNAPGYTPPTSITQLAGADGILELFRRLGHGDYAASPVSIASIQGSVTTLESEDAVPEDDVDGIAGDWTGTPFSDETYSPPNLSAK